MWRGSAINQLSAEQAKWFHWCTVCRVCVTPDMKYHAVTVEQRSMFGGGFVCACVCVRVFVCVFVSLLLVLNRGKSGARSAVGLNDVFGGIRKHHNIPIDITLMSPYSIFISILYTFWCWCVSWYAMCIHKSGTVGLQITIIYTINYLSVTNYNFSETVSYNERWKPYLLMCFIQFLQNYYFRQQKYIKCKTL